MTLKKSGYKYRIEQELLKKEWEIELINSNEDWWDDEHWEICFKYDSKISFYLCFIVDPMFEGERKRGQGIGEVKASVDFPVNWNDNSSRITSICMYKRDFEIKLLEFVDDLEKYKKENYSNKDE